MNWRFWRRETSQAKPKRLSGPKELPQQIGGYLVKKRLFDPDWVWSLKCVVRPAAIENRRDFRLFNPNEVEASRVRIANFDSLDDHPELILYDGWYDKHTGEVELIREIENQTN